MLPDTSSIDSALIGKLAADGELTALMPGGVFWDVAMQGLTRFVIVSQVFHEAVYSLDGWPAPAPVFERPTYTVKAVMSGSSAVDTQKAAYRIYQLLHAQPLAINGYDLMTCEYKERIRYTEVDPDTQVRWNHRGGNYEIWAAADWSN